MEFVHSVDSILNSSILNDASDLNGLSKLLYNKSIFIVVADLKNTRLKGKIVITE